MPAETLYVTALFTPRFGQWVMFKTAAPIPGAHTADDFTVGIFTGPQRPSPVALAVAGKVDEKPPEAAQLLPARIMVVDADGFNLPRPQVKGVPQGNWWLLPSEVKDLQPVTERAHVPVEDHEDGKEHTKRTCHPGWTPVA